jgi:hypothetical protein
MKTDLEQENNMKYLYQLFIEPFFERDKYFDRLVDEVEIFCNNYVNKLYTNDDRNIQR